MNVDDNNISYRNISVGLVDDHVLLRRGLASMLENKGMKITLQADNGQQLVDHWAEQESPQVMLVDVNMPVMDGYATAKWLRQHHPEVKILALSVIDDAEAVRKMIANGADGYVLKDAHPQALVNAVETVFEKGFFLSDQLNRSLIAGAQGSG